MNTNSELVVNGYENFIDNFMITKKEKETYNRIFDRLSEESKFITKWENEDLDKFIESFDSISENSVNKYLQIVRDFYSFVCKELGLKPKTLKLTKNIKDYINLEELLARTLNENEYKALKNLLVCETPEGTYNYRDKVLLELGWLGLTNNEIKTLRIDNIEFYKEFNQEKAKLKLKRRTVVIENKEIVYDIKMTIEHKKYWRVEKGGREYFINLKETPMLIKAVAMRQSNKDEVSNPSNMLNGVLKNLAEQADIIPGVKIENINLSDIRRSRIIELLKLPYLKINDIKNIYDKKTESDLYWLQGIANIIKREELQQLQQSNRQIVYN